MDESQKLWDETSACYLILLPTTAPVFEGVQITPTGKLFANNLKLQWHGLGYKFHAKGVVPFNYSFITKLEASEWFPLMQGFLSSKPHGLQILLLKPSYPPTLCHPDIFLTRSCSATCISLALNSSTLLLLSSILFVFVILDFSSLLALNSTF